MTGVVTHGRPENETGAEVLGLFLNTVPLRVGPTRSWAELRSVFAAEVALLPHRRYPLFEIQRLAGRSPLFETALRLPRLPRLRRRHGRDRLEFVADEFFEQTNLPLTAGFNRSRSEGRLEVALSYDTAEFPAPQMDAVLELYHRVLAAVAEPAGDPRPTTPYLAADLALIESWNATDRSYAGRVPAGADRRPGRRDAFRAGRGVRGLLAVLCGPARPSESVRPPPAWVRCGHRRRGGRAARPGARAWCPRSSGSTRHTAPTSRCGPTIRRTACGS